MLHTDRDDGYSYETMKVNGKHFRTIWLDQEKPGIVNIIDQRKLPHKFEILELSTVEECAVAIRDMYVRGAGLIGAAAAFGMYLAGLHAENNRFDVSMREAADLLLSTRPTAKDLEWAIERQLTAMESAGSHEEKRRRAFSTACAVSDESVERGRMIGEHGAELIRQNAAEKNGKPVAILTHCNAGWLAFVDHGSALAPIYAAFDRGTDVHVWVDETRPRNQGARLTAWELGEHGVPHTLIADNAGGHLMQHGRVDMVIVGADRVTSSGDAANKIGTYLKALAARDNGVPFYVALPSSTFDWGLDDGVRDIPIEERNPDEVRIIQGRAIPGSGDRDPKIEEVLLCPEKTPAYNPAFDVTPAGLITALITERGVCPADRESIQTLYPEATA